MAWYDSLIQQGAVPAGATPKTVVEPGGEPGYYQTDVLNTMLRGFNQYQKKQQENLKKQSDMYRTLREAGYAPKRAYEAVINNRLPEPGEMAASPLKKPVKEKTYREKILQKISDGVTLTEGEQRVYDETIKHKSGDIITKKDSVANPVDDEAGRIATIIKAAKEGSASSGGAEEMIPVLDPQGRKMKIPKSRLSAALKAGWKKR